VTYVNVEIVNGQWRSGLANNADCQYPEVSGGFGHANLHCKGAQPVCKEMNEGHLKSQRITQKLECNTVMNTRHYKRNLWTQYPPKTSKNIYASCFELLINATPEQSWSAFLHSKSKQ